MDVKTGYLGVLQKNGVFSQQYVMLERARLLIAPADDAAMDTEEEEGALTPEPGGERVRRFPLVELDGKARVVREAGEGFCFTLRTGAGVGLRFSAPDAAERESWISTLRECARALRQVATAAPRRPGTRVVHGNGTHFELDEHYVAETFVGAGGFGAVLAAVDARSRQRVAVKKVVEAFESLLTARRAVREVRLMRQLQHRNLLRLIDVLPPPSSSLADFEDVYIVSELMDTDLAHVIRSNLGLTPEHIRWFVYQMVCAVHYLHSAGVAHRDLKPANVFVNRNCDLRIGDFGHARNVRCAANLTRDSSFSSATGAAAAAAGSCAGSDDDGGGSDLTDYVVTRWYRAPEVLLAAPYGCAVDMWSLGCIFGELLGGKPLFRAASYVAMLRKITALVGSPSVEGGDLDFLETHPKALRFLAGLPQHNPADLAAVFPSTPPEALDLLQKMLRFDHRSRITAVQALAHPYLAPLRDAARLEEAPAPCRLSLADIELLGGPAGALRHGAQEARIHKLKIMLLEEIACFHPEVRSHSGVLAALEADRMAYAAAVAARSCGNLVAEGLVQPAALHGRAVSMPMTTAAAAAAVAGPGALVVEQLMSC